MKKYLKIILFSCLVGSILAGAFFFNIKEKVNARNKPILYAFQVGVFKNRDNANNFKARYTTARVLFDKEYYRVFIGITKDNKELLISLFDAQNLSYYIKEIEVNNENFLETIQKYDDLLTKTGEENKMMVIKNMLESMPNEL